METAQSQRLFFALVADGVHESLRKVCDYLNDFSRLIKIVPPSNCHSTLKFLGNVDINTSKKLRDDFIGLSFNDPVTAFTLMGLGGFPDERHPRVIWCGIKAHTADLSSIYNTIENLCAVNGFKKENINFMPHFTLARTRRDRRLPNELTRYIYENRDTSYGELQFTRIVLFRSELGKDGSVYSALEEIRL